MHTYDVPLFRWHYSFVWNASERSPLKLMLQIDWSDAKHNNNKTLTELDSKRNTGRTNSPHLPGYIYVPIYFERLNTNI